MAPVLALVQVLVREQVVELAADQGMEQAQATGLGLEPEAAQELDWAQVQERGLAVLEAELPSQEPSCFRS